MNSLACAPLENWSDPSPHRDAFVVVNGLRLQYLDWGGEGPALILIHGMGDNPHMFDDLACAFTDRHRVIAYARRGAGRSAGRPPYDMFTLKEDLRYLMDALGFNQADLVGWSMGGNEITAMATEHPDRVRSLIYFDAAYDYADPDFKTALAAIPSRLLDTPPSAMESLDAYRAYAKSHQFPSLGDMGRVEAYLRENVVIQPDGRLTPRITKDAMDTLIASLLNNPARDYTRINTPTLAIYATSQFDPLMADRERRAEASLWERKYWAAFRRKSMDRVRREISKVEVLQVPGAHDSFFLTSRGLVVSSMRRILGAEPRARPAAV
jgi:pimeloyl-ACP methyl ester carboxylesterase